MKYTDNAIKIIKEFQPCRLRAYKNPRGVWAIGYGHTNGVIPTQVLENEEEAEILLRDDADIAANAIENLLDTGKFSFIPNKNEVDALVSFTINQGSSNLSRLCVGRNEKMIGMSIVSYDTLNGVVIDAWTKMRKKEQELYQTRKEVELPDPDPIIITDFEDLTVPNTVEPPITANPDESIDISTLAFMSEDGSQVFTPKFVNETPVTHVEAFSTEQTDNTDEIAENETPVTHVEAFSTEQTDNAEEVTEDVTFSEDVPVNEEGLETVEEPTDEAETSVDPEPVPDEDNSESEGEETSNTNNDESPTEESV